MLCLFVCLFVWEVSWVVTRCGLHEDTDQSDEDRQGEDALVHFPEPNDVVRVHHPYRHLGEVLCLGVNRQHVLGTHDTHQTLTTTVICVDTYDDNDGSHDGQRQILEEAQEEERHEEHKDRLDDARDARGRARLNVKSRTRQSGSGRNASDDTCTADNISMLRLN